MLAAVCREVGVTVPVSSLEIDEVLFELTQPLGRDNPYPRYEVLRRKAPVARAPDGALVVSRYADCDVVLHDARYGRADPDDIFGPAGLADWRDHSGVRTVFTSMLSVNPPNHTRLRRLVSRVFTARQVVRLRQAVTALVDALLDGLDGDVDFIDAFAFPLPVAVIGELLGIPEADRAAFQPLVRDWTLLLDVFGPEVLQRGDAAATEIRDYLATLAAERRRQPREDLLSALVAATDEGDRLTEDELLTTGALLFAAGFETTTHLLGNGLVALLDNPDQLELMRRNQELATSAVEELLRFDSPVQINTRTALTDTEVAGLPVPRGERVVCYLGAGNRDPQRFDDPDRLDITRHPNAPLSFGGGIHYCLGAPLARLEAQVAIPALLDRYPKIRIAGQPRRRESLTLRGYLSLPVSTS
jgi:cytochrome P450